jgi:hypothetical protein
MSHHRSMQMIEGAGPELSMTAHAIARINARRLSRKSIWAAISYGRIAYARNATVYAIGRREIAHFRQIGLDLSKFEGIQVVCDKAGIVITAYRNRSLKRLKTN